MKTLLLNDASAYHSGCKEVINVLTNYYSPIILCNTQDEIDVSVINEVDRVILNGEGTLHHNAPRAKKFLGYLREAQKNGKETHIVNSVWQEMGTEWNDVLLNSSVIEVREVLSKREIEKYSGVVATVILDASIHSNVEHTVEPELGVCLGGSFYGELNIDWNDYTRVDIFKSSWSKLVNVLKSANVLITGRHHEMYAALKARTPVITVPGNTWKNEGLFHTIGVPELLMSPTKDNILATVNGEYNDRWNVVWDFLSNYEYKYARK